ncbi:hypothetical protein Tco_0747030 [Tanacetum coccineum]
MNTSKKSLRSLTYFIFSRINVPTRQILDYKGAIPTKTAADAKTVIQEMAEYSQNWHNGTSSKARSTETSDGLAAIQAQLNNLEREIKKVNKKVYTAQFGAPYKPGGQYRAAGPGFYQRNNINSLYPDRRQTLEESLTKFMADSSKRHEENSNIIKEIRASTDASIRDQKNVNADYLPSLSVNLITKSFYYSIIKDKDDHEGKRVQPEL